MKTRRIIVLSLLVACWTSLGCPSVRAQAPNYGEKIKQMLNATGFKYTKHNEETWSVDLERKSLGKTKVIISYNAKAPDLIVVFAIIGKKAGIQKTTQFMDAVLRANHDFDYAKIGLDKDGDLFVRIDSPLRLIDSDLLKYNINQTANASDELFGKVRQFVKR